MIGLTSIAFVAAILVPLFGILAYQMIKARRERRP